MRRAFGGIFFLSLLLSVGLSYATPPVHLWSLGGIGEGYDVAFDGAGNVYGVSAVFSPDSVVGGGSITIGKWSPNGVPISSRVIVGHATPQAIDVDAAGNVIVSAVVTGAIDFGNGSSNGGRRLVMVKYDTNQSMWTHEFPHTVLGPVTFDAVGNVVLAAAFEDTVNFGGGPLIDTGRYDTVIAKYDETGAFLWNRHVTGPDDKYPYAVAADQANNIVLTGELHGSADFGGGPLPAPEGSIIFVAKLAPDGSHLWSKSFGAGCCGIPIADTGQGRGLSVAVDAAGDVAITGEFNGKINFGGADLTGGEAIFVAKFDGAGNHLWSRGMGNVGPQIPRGIAMDAAGNSFITGGFYHPVDFGGGPIAGGVGDHDVYIAGYDPSGVHMWSRGFGSDYSLEYATAVAVDPSGNIAITGRAYGSVDFGGGPLASDGMFVAKFSTEDLNPVFITQFHANPGNERVSLEWELWSDEALEGLSLLRSEARSSYTITIAKPRIDARTFVDNDVKPGGTYSYQLLVRTAGGNDLLSQTETVTLPAFTETLGQNRPNPFNPSTTIEYTLAASTRAVINIYDAAGRMVTSLDGGMQPAGTHKVEWNGRDSKGRSVASGVYFYQLVGNSRSETRKMVLLK